MDRFPKLEIIGSPQPLLPLYIFVRYVWKLIRQKDELKLETRLAGTRNWPSQFLMFYPTNICVNDKYWLILGHDFNGNPISYELWEESGHVFARRCQ